MRRERTCRALDDILGIGEVNAKLLQVCCSFWYGKPLRQTHILRGLTPIFCCVCCLEILDTGIFDTANAGIKTAGLLEHALYWSTQRTHCSLAKGFKSPTRFLGSLVGRPLPLSTSPHGSLRPRAGPPAAPLQVSQGPPKRSREGRGCSCCWPP